MRMASPWRRLPSFQRPMTKSGATSRQGNVASTVSPCGIGCGPDRSARLLRLFIHVFDAGLIQQDIRPFRAIHLEAALVVPLDDAVERLAIAQHEHHRRLRLHLLYVIKVLSVGLVRGNRLLLLWRGGSAGRRDLFLDLVERRTNKFTIDSFHCMPSFEEIMTDRRFRERGGVSDFTSDLHQ